MKMKKAILVICVAAVVVSVAARGNSGEEAENILDGTAVSTESMSEYSSETETLPQTGTEEIPEAADITESSVISDVSDTGTEVTESEKTADVSVDGIRPEIKEALDSYEAFFVEYCDFMKKYSESPDDLTLLDEYAEYMAQYLDTMNKMEQLDDGELSDEELEYYLKVTNRINEMLIDVSL